MPVADANGIRIHYEVHGEGRPLLFILGFGADVSEHTALIDQLAALSRIIAFDNRGAGRTDKPDAPYSIELMAADALGVMDALGVSRADVLGISLGGRIALELALGHPERVERLILVSTSARVVPSWACPAGAGAGAATARLRSPWRRSCNAASPGLGSSPSRAAISSS
jgi:3-oxoadipate enol-lactonase